ncbi:MAG: hypothetical protein IJ638_01200 [Alphaproteobacteria bacterium]|nr:hypothetical protein [Alphaproteobacteria bacterium]
MKRTKKEISNFIDAYMNSKDKEIYTKLVNGLKNKHGEWLFDIETLSHKIQQFNKQYNQDGTFIYEEELKKIKNSKYPKDVIEKLKEELQKIFFSKPEEKEKDKKNKKSSEYDEKLKKIKPYLKLSELILQWAHSDFESKDLELIGDELSSLPLDIQKLIVDLGHFRYFTHPSMEIIKYALETNNVRLNNLEPSQRTKEIDIIAAKTGNIYDIKEVKNLSKEARLAFIENNPERIITKINIRNWATRDLTIYDLTKEELKAYEHAMEVYKGKQEQKQIDLVRKDYRNIEKIENPSSIVRNYAVQTFRRQWER